MTVATQPEPAGAARASFTCTWPRGPLTVPPSTVLAIVPRFPALAGAVIDSAPPVTVTVAWVSAAEAGPATASVSAPAAATPSKLRVILLLIVFLSRNQAEKVGVDEVATRNPGDKLAPKRGITARPRLISGIAAWPFFCVYRHK